MAQIDILAKFGEDALANHFQVVIPAFSLLGVNVAEINMRILSVDIPEYSVGTYEIWKRGRKRTRVSGIQEYDPEVSFTFRPDKYWRCYSSLMNWMQFIQNNQTMAMASDSGLEGIGGDSTYRTDFEIWSLSSLDKGIPNQIWTVQEGFPTSIDGISFDETNGEPLEVSVTMQSTGIIYPS